MPVYRKFRDGFTLVELLVVLTLISLLIFASYLSVPTILMRARDAVRKANIERVGRALEEYYQNHDCYPSAIPTCRNPIQDGNLTLLSGIPCDPFTKLSYVYVNDGSKCSSWYQLYGNLEYGKDKIIDRIGCREGCGPDCQFNYGRSSTNQDLNPYCGANPAPPPGQYVCSPGGACEVYEDPERSGCPDIYIDDPTCQNKCADKIYRCHNASGKLIP